MFHDHDAIPPSVEAKLVGRGETAGIAGTREREQAERVVWTAVSSGYQPEMPRFWFAALYAFYDEAKVDRVFTNSVFWVVTRTNDCFY